MIYFLYFSIFSNRSCSCPNFIWHLFRIACSLCTHDCGEGDKAKQMHRLSSAIFLVRSYLIHKRTDLLNYLWHKLCVERRIFERMDLDGTSMMTNRACCIAKTLDVF